VGNSDTNETTKLVMEIGKLIGDRCANEIRTVETNLNNRIDAHHRETMQQIEKIKDKQNEMAVKQAEMGARLQEGERRFEDLEERVSKVEDLEQRVVTLEERDRVTLEERDRSRDGKSSPETPDKKKIIVVGGAVAGGGLSLWGLFEGLKRIFS
jgi:hypothetical protein